MDLQGRGDRCGDMGIWGYGHMRYRSGGYCMMMLGWREKEEEEKDEMMWQPIQVEMDTLLPAEKRKKEGLIASKRDGCRYISKVGSLLLRSKKNITHLLPFPFLSIIFLPSLSPLGTLGC